MESSLLMGIIILLISIGAVYGLIKIIKFTAERKQTISEKFNFFDILNIHRQKTRKVILITWRITKSALLIYVGVFTAISCLFLALQSHVLYQPDNYVDRTPLDIGLTYEDISFSTSDGVQLSGWYIPENSSKGTIMFCHGNAGNIADRLAYLRILHQQGFDVFIFDYRGYGNSEGKTTEKGTYLDVEAAFGYLVQKRNVSENEVILYGRSLGGAAAINIAQEHLPKMLIIDSSFSSYQKISSDVLSSLFLPIPVKILARFEYNSIDNIQKITCPVLVIHSRNDKVIPYSHGKELFENANGPKELLTISGTHNEGFLSSENYETGLNDFIEKHRHGEIVIS